MRAHLALLIIGTLVATPCASAERFISDKPTPLKQLKHRNDDGNGARFAGSVQLSGGFLIVEERRKTGPN